MTDRPTPTGQRPVLAGLLALTAVAVVVGLLAGGTMLMGTKILGLEGAGGSASGEATSGETLFLPEPEKTERPDGPLITLDVDPVPQPTGDEAGDEKRKKNPKKKAARKRITLNVGQPTVSAMQRIDLTGTYPDGSGAILRVQRFENGSWADFPVTVSVSNGSFSTYVMTGQRGETRFRMLDTDSGKVSNFVKVTIT